MLSRVFTNTALQFLTRGLELLAGLLVNAWIARSWGTQAFGQIGYFAGLIGVFTFLFDFGIGNMLIRRMSCERRSVFQLLLEGAAAILPFSTIGTLTVVGIGLALNEPLHVLLLICVQQVLVAFVMLIRATFYAYERMEFEAVAVGTERICWLGAGLWLATQPASLVGYFAWYLLCRALNLLIGLVLFIRYILPLADRTVRCHLAPIALIKEAAPFGLSWAFTSLYANINILLITQMATVQEAGHFRAAATLIVPLSAIAFSITNALFPKMAAAAQAPDYSLLSRYSATSNRLVLFAAMPIGLFIGLFAPGIIKMLFGEAYLPAVQLLQLLSFSIPLQFLGYSIGGTLTASGYQGRRTLALGIATVFNVVGNLLAIYFWGALGACMATLATECLLVILLELQRRSLLGRAPVGNVAAVRSLGIAALVLVPLSIAKIPMVSAGIVLAIAYPLLLLGSRTFTSFESQLLLARGDS